MRDEEILRLYRERCEEAITETQRQYGALCGTIAQNILRNRQDAEECVNDTWHRAWNSIPPEEPRSLAAYLGRITRNLALNRLQKQNRLKRGGGEMTLIWEELGEMLPDRDTPEQHWERRAIAAALERFLAAEHLTVTKKTKKGEQEIDLKEKMTVQKVERKPGEYVLEVRLPAGGTVNWSPMLVTGAYNALLGREPYWTGYERLAILTKDFQDFC